MTKKPKPGLVLFKGKAIIEDKRSSDMWSVETRDGAAAAKVGGASGMKPAIPLDPGDASNAAVDGDHPANFRNRLIAADWDEDGGIRSREIVFDGAANDAISEVGRQDAPHFDPSGGAHLQEVVVVRDANGVERIFALFPVNDAARGNP
jgi:hypothetical protein